MNFEWDKAKNAANQKKHRLSFEEAKTVFLDEHARLIADPDHSLSEDRFVLLGLSQNLNLLVVVHVEKVEANAIRIISARKATKTERNFY